MLADIKLLILFEQGHVTILVPPDCDHMAGYVCPGFAGLRMLPGAKEIKIKSVLIVIGLMKAVVFRGEYFNLFFYLSFFKLTWLPCSELGC